MAGGHSRADLGRLVAAGRLQRVRRGWYATPGADPRLVRAVSAGGSVTCVSALALAGLWSPPAPGLHVRIPANSRRVTRAGGDIVHHRLGRPAGTPGCPVDSFALALACARGCVTPAEWVAMADAVLRAGTRGDDLLAQMVRVDADHAAALIKLMGRTCGRSESGSESLLRHALTSVNLPVRTQVWIGPDRVDVLIGDRLVVEVDSRAHHTGVERYAADRRRDQRLSARGYLVIRVTYEQVLYEREALVEYIQTICARGMHRWGHRQRPMGPP